MMGPIWVRNGQLAVDGGSTPPPFSFRSCRKENGPWTVQKKRTLGAELAHKAQVRLKYGSCSKGVPPKLGSPTGARYSRPSNRRPLRAYSGGQCWWSSESPPSWPRCRCPVTPGRAPAEREGEDVQKHQNPRSHHAAGRDFLDFYRTLPPRGVFSLGPCTARSLFGVPKREWGVHSPCL